jgi:hypothetical protein
VVTLRSGMLHSFVAVLKMERAIPTPASSAAPGRAVGGVPPGARGLAP